MHSQPEVQNINVAQFSPALLHEGDLIFRRPGQITQGIKPYSSKEILAKTSDTVNEISAQCGFENTSYFSYLFKQHQQCSPSKYRAKYSYI